VLDSTESLKKLELEVTKSLYTFFKTTKTTREGVYSLCPELYNYISKQLLPHKGHPDLTLSSVCADNLYRESSVEIYITFIEYGKKFMYNSKVHHDTILHRTYV